MKIGVISDTHDRRELTQRVIEKLEEKECKVLIHCGDLCAPAILKVLKNFRGEIYCCFGNTDDRYRTTKFSIELGINLVGDSGEIEIDNKKIFFNHFPDIAKAFAMTNKYDAVFYGHTHKSEVEKINNTLLVNSGGIFATKEKNPKYAVYDTKENQVEIFELKDD